MDIQIAILKFFEGLHNGFLNTLVQMVTVFGESNMLIAVILFIYWNINKKKGFTICLTLMTASSIMGVAKAIVRFPRPWLVIDGLGAIRKETATGYSFPSGHTTSAASTYGSMAESSRKRWFSILCAVMIALVGLSRIYLCVHWPLDVAGGLFIGLGTAFILFNVFNSLFDDKERCIKVMAILGVVFTLLFVIIGILLTLGKLDMTAFDELNTMIAPFGGMGLGCALERKLHDFEVEDGCWKRKILRYLIGFVVVMAIQVGLKAFLSAIGIYNPFFRSLRYFLVGLFAATFPILGYKWGLFTKRMEA